MPKTEKETTMSKIRVIESTEAAIENDYFMRDSRLSLKSKALLSQMHAIAPCDDFSLEEIENSNKDKEQSIRSAMRELEQYSYLERTQNRDKRGQVLPVNYIIYENPYEGMAMPELDDEYLCYESFEEQEPEYDDYPTAAYKYQKRKLELLDYMLDEVHELIHR